YGGQLPARRIFRGQDPEGSEACRPAGRAAHQVRVCDKSQDGKSDRPNDSARGVGAGDQADQMRRSGCQVSSGKIREKMKMKITVLAFGAMLFALCSSADAQQTGKIFRIGFLAASTASGNTGPLDTFRQEMHKFGWIEGKNIAFDYRYGEQKPERLPELAKDLARLKVDLILVVATPAALAA